MKYNHYEYCNAAICAGDPNLDYKENVVWYAGEEVCQKKPFQKFQRKQSVINQEVKKGTFRNLTESYTADELEHKSI